MYWWLVSVVSARCSKYLVDMLDRMHDALFQAVYLFWRQQTTIVQMI